VTARICLVKKGCVSYHQVSLVN